VTGEWPSFATALTGALSALPLQGVLIVRDSVCPQYFVQYAHHGAHIRAEAAGGVDPEGHENLTEQERAGLAAIGWHPPDDRHFNWWWRLDWPATSKQYRALGEMSARALHEVYGIAAPTTLEYEAWIDGSADRPELPQLGTARYR
jgi:hypothetical protein